MNLEDFYLDDKSATIHIYKGELNFEYHWTNFDGKHNTFVVSYCPMNHPSLRAMTMTDLESASCINTLLDEGWEKM